MTDITEITLPPLVPFPVTLLGVHCRHGESVAKHQALFHYKWWEFQDDPNSTESPPPKVRVERIGTYESPIEGEVQAVEVKLNEEILHSGVVLCRIKEPCGHAVQYGGLCALCGKAVEDEKDYLGYNYEDRATIAMSHDNTGLKISLDEAQKIEENTYTRLANEEKLILVVDLDQTVIHATVDPTVGEWQRDPNNPNYRAVKDVQSFCLEEETILPPDWKGPRPQPTKCWYYVKLRPGLKEFLERVAQLYELHIYTMATRNYALAIANIIDPTREYFGDRILSRDESGSLTHKNLKRLFPVDQSMVVIIDDRGDVWQWESNLIKVVPYDFFVGIGDINSSFLPKKTGQLTGPTKNRHKIKELEELATDTSTQVEDRAESETPESVAELPVDRILELGGGEDNTDLLAEQSLTRNQLLEQQQHDRPLAKLQHNLEKIHEESDDDNDDDDNLLYDDDTELHTLRQALERIHQEYYQKYKLYQNSQLRDKPDLTIIIPQLKSRCLEGITVLFSGILQIGVNLDLADIVIWCRQFGMKVVSEVYADQVTHVVCRDPNASTFKAGLTFKVRVARRLIPNVKIVNPDWLFACLSLWEKVDETPYLIQCEEDDWRINEADIDKYKQVLESKREEVRPRQDSIVSLEEYDLDNANAEVDDFLAGISGDEDDGDEDDEEEQATVDDTASGTDSFIRNAYKRAREDDEDGPYKKQHADADDTGEVDLDQLEQELLDGFDDLE